ncbi:uncharacterized protein LOC115764321 [Drosophila novamexicana]|uniref:uncharacterized protein LOC115764321 n=1 Tax=Drosophila novamexicana TaxID=47314 RepID=UPI0011E58E2C|nr:uncharacterized protein LOC115764321 [Drosophila novamexicana]
MKLVLCLLLYATCSRNGEANNTTKPLPATSVQRAEVEKLRSELNAAFDAGEETPEGVIVQPEWTKHGSKPSVSGKPSKVIVNEASLRAAEALRTEINDAVAKQGHTEEVRQLEAAVKAKAGGTQNEAIVGSTRDEMLGSSQPDQADQANVVDATPMDIDLKQLQQLQLSKRRTREMLVLSRIEENLQFMLGADVSHWLQLQQNGSVYFLGRRSHDLLLLEQQALISGANFHSYAALQPLSVPAGIDAILSYERWNRQAQLQESVVLLATQQQLLWYRLEANSGLKQFWHWPLGSDIDKLLAFVVENREYLVLMHNRTLSIYAHDVDGLEFWIVQRLQLEQRITALAVQDTGRDLLLAVGQSDEALIYAHNMRELALDAGLQLQLRQRLEAPKIADIAAFQMGGRNYLALGGLRPQILAYVQGQLVPRTLLGQNFGLVELFLPVPVRSYRDDLLLLVQHRVYFDTHTLLQLEVLVWNGEAFEASLPAPCELGTQTRYGAGCMLDEQREAGLAGAALLRQMQPPLLLVPRQAAPSGLFRLHTQLLPRNSELHDLQDIHDFMRNWVDEQDKLIKRAEQLLQAPEAEFVHYEELDTPLLINDGAILEGLHVNDAPWTAHDAAKDLHELLQQIRLLKQELLGLGGGRTKRQPQLFRYDYEQLEFDVVEVQELHIEQLNHAPFYVQNATLQFNGLINAQSLEVMRPQPIEQAKSLPSRTQQRLELDADLSCEFINGLAWTQFLQQLVWRQEPLQLSQLRVAGAVVFEDSLHLSALNELSFPDDYLWSQESSTSIVFSPKQFTQTLSANMVDTFGAINGCDPADAVTLSDEQDWPGWVTFSQLEVSEGLELNGSAQGRQFEEAPLNPTLTDSHHVHAACHFSKLIVNGPLQLRGLLDNSSFDALLGDLVQRPVDAKEELIIPAAKHVQHLVLPVDAHVLDGTLSGIPIEQFVAKHTEQTLHNLSSLAGYVYFHKLQLSGVYDGVQLEQLLAQALRVDAPLVAPTTRLHFVNEPQLAELQVSHMLNDVPLSSGYQTLYEPLHLSQARFTRLQAEQLDVTHNVTGPGHLNGYQLSELLSSEPRRDTVQVQDLILPMGVQASKLQGINAELLLGFLRQLDELPLLILHGQLQVEHIAVSGAVLVDDTLNGQNMDQLQRDVVWLDRPNELRTRWRFQQAPIFASDLLLQGSYNERLLPELLDDIVFRPDQDQELLIVGTKSFAGHVQILDTLQLQALNGVPFDRLANKLQPLDFPGELRLEGRLHVTHLQLEGTLNGQAIGQLDKQLRWDTKLGAFVQRGLVHLADQTQLQELTVLGHLGNRSLEPLQEFYDDLLDKRRPQLYVEGHKVFTGRVSIRGGAHIVHLNDINLEQLMQQLIFIDGSMEHNEVTLHTPVHFEAAVQMQQLHVDQLVLQGERLNDCNITEWMYDTLRVDRDWQTEMPVSFAQGSLDNNALRIGQLNELNLTRVVTLHTEQNLSFPLVANELHLADGRVQLHGLVNGRNLSEEYANTLLINAPKEQRVFTPLLMQSVDVSGTLLATAPINGDPNLNLSDVATLHEEQLRLQTPLNFARLHAPELRTRLHINGFNFSAWHEKSLWAQGRATQIISGNWNVRWLRVKQPQPPEHRAHEIYRRQSNALALRYRELCTRLARLFGLLRLPYQVKQLRRSFALKQAPGESDVRRVFALQLPAPAASYLLINELGCWTRIYRWNGTHYTSAGRIESGPINDATVLHQRNASANNNDQFSFMTSYELSDEQEEGGWNCSSLAHLQSWRTSAKTEIEPMDVPASKLQQLQQKHEAQQLQRNKPSYQEAIKYLSRPSTESQLRPHLDAGHTLSQEQYETLRQRLLQHLSFRLQTEVNITQLSIPESDLYDDEHLVEDFLRLMRQLRSASPSGTGVFASLPTDTLPLPNNPSRVLAARSAQLIWPVLEELKALHGRLSYNDSQSHEQQRVLVLQLEHTLRDVLLLANSNGRDEEIVDTDDDTKRLHAVIERLRELQQELEEAQQLDLNSAEARSILSMELPPPKQQWLPVETIRLYVGRMQHAQLLYARLTIVASNVPPIAPSTAPAAHIQLHHANGTLFQSLAADHLARQLTALRVRDETLLAFVESCCRVRVFIYRGIQGFVPFTQFHIEENGEMEQPYALQLLALRLPLQRSPGALYMLAVVQSRRVTFYELVMPGFFEPWLHC